MKEMGNNNFIHTLDAVYNLCSEIKELVNVETEKQEDEGSEGYCLTFRQPATASIGNNGNENRTIF